LGIAEFQPGTALSSSSMVAEASAATKTLPGIPDVGVTVENEPHLFLSLGEGKKEEGERESGWWLRLMRWKGNKIKVV